jgi:DNA replication protein DnaC
MEHFMLIEPMIQQLQQLRLRGMAAALTQLHNTPHPQALTFEERLGLMIQHELTDRHSQRLAQRLRWAKLPQQAVLEDLDTRTPRGIDPKLIASLSALGWVKDKLNVLIAGPCGVGKSFIASALAHAACRADYSVRSFRLPRLVEELSRHHAQANRSAFLKQLAKVDLLYLDDFGLAPLSDQTKRDLLEILEDRYDKKSTLITSQLPIEQWHAYLDEPTLADAILDRLVHNSYRLNLKGGSMRKHKRAATANSHDTAVSPPIDSH